MKRTLLSLALLLGVALVVDLCVRRLGGVPGPEAAQLRTAFSVGLLILGAWLTGRICERISLPAITGYLVFGMAAGPSVLALVPGSQVLPGPEGGAPPLRFASDLAIALIALSAGGEIHLPWLRGRVKQVLWVLLLHVVILFVTIAGLVLVAKPALPFLAEVDWVTAGVVAALCGVVMVAKSPTVAIAMISDYRAEGPMSQMILVITVIKDLMLIVLFATMLAIGKGLLDRDTALSARFLLAVGVQLVGSVALGGVVGLTMAWYVRRVRAHLGIFIVGCCLLIALVGEQHMYVAGQDIHLEPLLMALSAGLLMRNAWPRRSEPLFHTMESMSLPVYCLFFSLAGAKVHLEVFASLWHLSLVLVAVRAAATWGSIWLGLWAARLRESWGSLMWMGFLSQAGVSLVLVTLIGQNFEEQAWAEDMQTVLIGAIILNELFGPIAFRHALIRSGEAWQARDRGA